MIEILLISLIGGLFFCGTIALRVLSRREVNKMMSALIEDFKFENEVIKMIPVEEPFYAVPVSTEKERI